MQYHSAASYLDKPFLSVELTITAKPSAMGLHKVGLIFDDAITGHPFGTTMATTMMVVGHLV